MVDENFTTTALKQGVYKPYRRKNYTKEKQKGKGARKKSNNSLCFLYRGLKTKQKRGETPAPRTLPQSDMVFKNPDIYIQRNFVFGLTV